LFIYPDLLDTVFVELDGRFELLFLGLFLLGRFLLLPLESLLGVLEVTLFFLLLVLLRARVKNLLPDVGRLVSLGFDFSQELSFLFFKLFDLRFLGLKPLLLLALDLVHLFELGGLLGELLDLRDVAGLGCPRPQVVDNLVQLADFFFLMLFLLDLLSLLIHAVVFLSLQGVNLLDLVRGDAQSRSIVLCLVEDL